MNNSDKTGDRRWGLDTYSCRVHSEYPKVSQSIGLGLNCEKLYNTDSMFLHTFKPKDDYADAMNIIYYMFLTLVERVVEFTQKPKPQPKDQKKDSKKKKKTKKRGRGGRTPHDIAIPAADDEAEEDNDVDEEDGDKEPGDEEDADDNEMDETDQQPQQQDGGDNNNHIPEDKFHLFFEGVMSSDYNSKRFKDGDAIKKKISDYRFFFIIKDHKIDVNKIWEKMIKEIINDNRKKMNGKNHRSNPKTIVMPKSYEKWKDKITSKKKLAELMDVRLGKRFAVDKMNLVDGLTISDPNNPICATKFFNPAIMFFADTSPYARAVQRGGGLGPDGQANPAYTRESDDNDHTAVICFPTPKFVYRISESEMRVSTLYHKMIPHQQQAHDYQMKMMIPFILEDKMVKNVDECPDEPLPKPPADAGAPSLTSSSSSVGGLAPSGGGGNNDSTTAPAPNQNNHSTMTKQQVIDMAVQWGFDSVMAEAICPISNKSTTEQTAKKSNSTIVNEMLDQLSKNQHFYETYTGAYAAPRMIGTRNKNMIKRDFAPLPKDAVIKPENLPRTRRFVDAHFVKKLQDGTTVVDEKKKKMIARCLYLYNQNLIFELYKRNGRSADSNISPMARKIMEYAHVHKVYRNHGLRHDKIDKNYTIFVNVEIERFIQWEVVYMVNSSHKYMELYYKNHFDAYAMDFDRPHQSMMLVDENGGAGKSYMGSVLRKICIPDTIEVVTFETLKSRASDEVQQNDNICIFDEMDKSMIDKDVPNNDKERALKLLMSMNKVVAKYLYIEEDGTRKTKVTYSECITVFFANTNSSISRMSTAMMRRWHIGFVDERLGMTRNVTDIDLMSKMVGESEKVYEERLSGFCKLYQVLIVETEKLIYQEGMTQVTYHGATIMMFFISNELTLTGRVHPQQSMFIRVLTNSRINCILDALVCTLFTPGGKHFGKEEILVDQLKDLDPKLFVQAQHAVSAIALNMELLIDPVESIVKRALKRLYDDSWGNKDKSTHFKLHADGKTNDANWIRIPKASTLEILASKIQAKIPLLRDPPATNKYSKDVIKKCLMSWRDRVIAVRAFKMNEKDPKNPICTGTITHLKPVAQLDMEAKAFYFHTDFLLHSTNESPEQFFEKTIRDIFGRRHQLRQDFVWIPDPTLPHIRKILSVTGEKPREITDDRGQKKIITPFITIPSVVKLGEIEKLFMKNIGSYTAEVRNFANVPIESDLDSWAMEKRRKMIYITGCPINPAVLTDDIVEKALSTIKGSEKTVFDKVNNADNNNNNNSSSTNTDNNNNNNNRRRRPPLRNIYDSSGDESDVPLTNKKSKSSKAKANPTKAPGGGLRRLRRKSEDDSNSQPPSPQLPSQKGDTDIDLDIDRAVSDSELIPQFASDDESSTPNNNNDNHRDDHDEEDEEEQSQDNGDQLDDVDEDLDDAEGAGFFLGEPIEDVDDIDDGEFLYSTPGEKLIELYEHIGKVCDNNPDGFDIDFDKTDYIITENKEDPSKNVYHYDILAKEQYEQFMAGSMASEDRSFKYIPPEELESMYPDEAERAKKKAEIDRHNIKQYKKVCHHPMIFSMFQNEKFYKDLDTNYASEIKRLTKVKKTREERWNESKNIGVDDNDIIRILDAQEGGDKQQQPNAAAADAKSSQPFKLKTYTLKKEENGVKRFHRRATKSLVMVQNIMKMYPSPMQEEEDDNNNDNTVGTSEPQLHVDITPADDGDVVILPPQNNNNSSSTNPYSAPTVNTIPIKKKHQKPVQQKLVTVVTSGASSGGNSISIPIPASRDAQADFFGSSVLLDKQPHNNNIIINTGTSSKPIVVPSVDECDFPGDGELSESDLIVPMSQQSATPTTTNNHQHRRITKRKNVGEQDSQTSGGSSSESLEDSRRPRISGRYFLDAEAMSDGDDEEGEYDDDLADEYSDGYYDHDNDHKKNKKTKKSGKYNTSTNNNNNNNNNNKHENKKSRHRYNQITDENSEQDEDEEGSQGQPMDIWSDVLTSDMTTATTNYDDSLAICQF